ncbi:MAG: helix-turn-helix transcriptional regulator [Armatimonadetes bacterium]|nr:helix-turn-helix transcriptional regulator [Armatimonadota bacterium]
MSAPTELVRGNAVVLILSCLAREPMHGYRIAREIEKQSEGYFALGEGTLYPHLHQLEKDGLIEGYWETTPSGRERKSYRITERGTSELARRREEWRRFQSNINRILGLAPECLQA